MIVTSQLQSRSFCEDEFGFGTFGWTPVGKIELERIISRIANANLNIEIIGIIKSHKNKKGLGRARNQWSKAQSASVNIFFDPNDQDHSISMVATSILDHASQITNASVPVLMVESSVYQSLVAEVGINKNSELDNLKIICY